MGVVHVKNNAVADWSGVVTVHNSAGITTTINASDIVRPSDWNSQHNLLYTLSGNTNNASTASGTNVVFQGMGQVTLVGSTGTIGINVAPGTATLWYPYNEAVNVVANIDQGRMFIAPVPTPTPAAGGEVQIDRLCIPIHFTHPSGASSGNVTASFWQGLYTKNASTLSLAYSTSITTAWTWTSNNSDSQQGGIRLLTIPWTTTIQDGRYYVANIARSTSGGAANATLQQVLISQMNSSYSGIFGVASNSTMQWPLGFAFYSTTTSGLPASMAFSNLIGNSSNIARPPTWFMMLGTA